ncbi:MAG TPA: choice-of-anchor tandem repeat GloVer-containing protein [Terriglobia bacterium]|nr:choice-of-anchor tandem repeat GloVer-containing protein [Terriglobia bacterium]
MKSTRTGHRWAAVIVAATLMMLAAAIALPAQTFTTLYSFQGYPKDGLQPYAGLTQGADGNFYGTTFQGGVSSNCEYGCGTVFRITSAGALTILHSFDQTTDGWQPTAGLVQGLDGNFYGTTTYGGTSGGGTVYKMTPAGAVTTLYSFCSQSNCTDGYGIGAALILARDGNFYGTAEAGGVSQSCGAEGCGTVFKISPQGVLTTIHNFDSTDGSQPFDSLIQAVDGNFYGTTALGGAYGSGTAFTMTAGGTLTTLHSFDFTDGGEPKAALVQTTDGNFYGTTTDGGGGNDGGTVFKLTPTGTFTTLYSFCSQNNCTDGQNPNAAMIEATDGSLYGTTVGFNYNFGTIFKISQAGTLTTLVSFDGTNGRNPYAGLLQATDGNIYGTTAQGGTSGYGTVFSLSVGLLPFVETEPSFGKVGRNIKILGTNLTGATSVTFNGTAATFTVELPTAIKTTVPTGATTGPVHVVTPSGTLTSNVNFRVE